jgi:hypothetical protein
MNPKKHFATIAVALVINQASAQKRAFNTTSTLADAAMQSNFKSPPMSARPWVFWMWLRVNTSEEAITKDLEEMHAKGIEGTILYESGTGSELSSTKATMVLKDKKYVVTPTQDFKGAYMTELPTQHLQPWDNRQRSRAHRGKVCFKRRLGGHIGPYTASVWAAADALVRKRY